MPRVVELYPDVVGKQVRQFGAIGDQQRRIPAVDDRAVVGARGHDRKE